MVSRNRETDKILLALQRTVITSSRKEKILQKSVGELKENLSNSKRILGYARKHGVISWEARKGDFDYSVVMAEYEKLIDEISKDLISKNKSLVSTQKRIYELLAFVSPFELIFNRLTKEERKLTEEKYLIRLSNYQIAEILHCSEKRVRTMQKLIIKMIQLTPDQMQTGIKQLFKDTFFTKTSVKSVTELIQIPLKIFLR